MSSTAQAPTPHSTDFDPDAYRMSVGDHLEELRRRLLLGVSGFVAVFIFFIIPPVGTRVTSAFCRPLIDVLLSRNLNPQLFYTGIADGFLVFVQISLISAAAIASPWMLYQLWQFVVSGLYPHERKVIQRYVPLSLILLVGGMAFVYFLVLPWSIRFFVDFGNQIPLPSQFISSGAVVALPAGTVLPNAPLLEGDPQDPRPGDFWFNHAESRLKISVGPGDVRVIPFGPQNLLAPHITLPDYISLVMGMLLMFGLSFQTPLVVLALAKVGIVDLDQLRSARRYVYFAMAIVAAAITPGDVITATVALLIPLALLYELGIALAVWTGPGPDRQETP